MMRTDIHLRSPGGTGCARLVGGVKSLQGRLMPFGQHRVGSNILFVLALMLAVFLAACEQTAQQLPTTPPGVVPEQPVVALTDSAQQRFSAVRLPAALAGPSVIGGYARGRLARAQVLPPDR